MFCPLCCTQNDCILKCVQTLPSTLQATQEHAACLTDAVMKQQPKFTIEDVEVGKDYEGFVVRGSIQTLWQSLALPCRIWG